MRKHFGRPPPRDRATIEHWEKIKGMEGKVRPHQFTPPPDMKELEEQVGALKLKAGKAPEPTSSDRGY